MMKDVIGLEPRTKDKRLREFATRGFLLVDATYAPDNHAHLSKRARNKLILDDVPLLLKDLRGHAEPTTGVILV